MMDALIRENHHCANCLRTKKFVGYARDGFISCPLCRYKLYLKDER